MNVTFIALLILTIKWVSFQII